jgi:Toprim domain
MVERNKSVRFNAAVLKIISALDGDPNTGRCLCPCHDDGENPSLEIRNGDRVPVILHCHGRNDRSHDLEIIEYLNGKGVWPGSSELEDTDASVAADKARNPDERRQYALDIRDQLEEGNGFKMAQIALADYFLGRGLNMVPATVMFALPVHMLGRETRDDAVLRSHSPGMVFTIRDKIGEIQGLQVTWLDFPLIKTREQEPRRQTYGLLKGNFLDLATKLDFDKPPQKLIIGEGAETVLAAMQLTGLVGIATGGKVGHVDPPQCAEYIILVDCDDDGGSRRAAGELAQRLAGSIVRLATPARPEDGKKGYDFNDALVDAGRDEAKLAELARSIVEAPVFEDIQTPEEKREIQLSALAALRLDDPFGYDQARSDAAKRLKVRVSALDEAVIQRGEAIKAARSKAPAIAVNMKLLAESAHDIIGSEDVLELFAQRCGKVIAGEESHIKVAYLAATSRLFDKAMHIAVKGASAGGKSQLRGLVVDHFPPESVIKFTTLSEKALLYLQDDFQHKILSMGEAVGVEEQKLQNYLMRELMSEGKLRYLVSMKVEGEIKTIVIEKNGPVAFFVTTAKNALDPENETRMLSLEIDDSEQQTRAVLEKVAELEGLNKPLHSESFKPWHDYQRWLAAGEVRVVIPFAVELSRAIRATNSVRLRRDFRQLLLAIKAHALLHRENRERDADGFIVATIEDDYRIVRRLMSDLLATAVDLKVRQTITDTVNAIKEIGEGSGVTVRQIADALRLDVSATRRRLRKAEFDGYVTNVEDQRGRGKRGLYIATDENITERGELLPTPEELERTYVGRQDADKSERLPSFGIAKAPPFRRSMR